MGAAGWHLDLVGPLSTCGSHVIVQRNHFADYAFLSNRSQKLWFFLPPFVATSCRKLSQSGFVSELRFSFF